MAKNVMVQIAEKRANLFHIEILVPDAITRTGDQIEVFDWGDDMTKAEIKKEIIRLLRAKYLPTAPTTLPEQGRQWDIETEP